MFDSRTTRGSSLNLMKKIYLWMSIGLGITGFISYYIASSPSAISYIMNPGVLIALVFLQLGIVVALSVALPKLSSQSVTAMFFIYSVLMGLSLSSVFLVFTKASIATTFFITAGMFASMALYGYFTKADLTNLGSMLLMGLWGLILALFVNMFLQNPMFDLVVSAIGVFVFCLLTAYDAQKLKENTQSLILHKEDEQKIAIMGALTLYLDFINLFLFLLRFTGRRRE